MKIVVCIKQVPETGTVKIDPKTHRLIRTGISVIINPFDKYALESALQLREIHGGHITAISMGPPQTIDALREAISMGVDEAICLSDEAFAGADTLATSYTLAQAIKKIPQVDLIICGKQAIDGDTAQVGPELGVFLNLPITTYVYQIALKDNKLFLRRELEDGYEVVESPLPSLLTVTKQIGEPRLPSLKGILAAKKREIPVWTAKDIMAEPTKIGTKGSATQVIKTFTPPPKTDREILKGDVSVVVTELVTKLKGKKIIF